MAQLAIVLPVKHPELGKSRLKPIINDEDRHALNCWLYHRAFDQVAVLSEQSRVYVVSKSLDVLNEASRRGFACCHEPDHCDLNGAIAKAAQQALGDRMAAIMVLPVDLPLMTTESLKNTVARFAPDVDILLVKDRNGIGTNLLMWRPIVSARFMFGPDSAAAYAKLIQKAGLRAISFRDPSLAFDLDTPDDLRDWIAMPNVSLPPKIPFG